MDSTGTEAGKEKAVPLALLSSLLGEEWAEAVHSTEGKGG